jgi:hypothetical protein
MTTDYIAYIDSVNGSDNNDGLTQNTAWATIDKALNSAPLSWTGKCRIYAKAGTYKLAANCISTGIPIGSTAEPFAFIGEMIDSGVGVATCSAGSTTTVINTSAVLVSDAHYGRRVRFLTGALAGKTSHVVANTTSSVTVLVPLSSAPLTSDTFVIEMPGTIIQLPDLNCLISSGGIAASFISTVPMSATFNSVKWKLGTITWLIVSGGTTHINFDSNEFILGTATNSKLTCEAGASISSRRLSTEVGPDNSLVASVIVSNSGSSSLVVRGLYPTSQSCALYVQFAGFLSGFTNLITDNASFSLSAYNSSVSYAYMRAGSLYVNDNASLWTPFPIVIDGKNLTSVGVKIEQGSIMVNGSPSVSVSNVNGDAVQLSESSRFRTASLTGTGNTGYGVKLGDGCMAVVSASSVTGAAGDIIVGDTVTTHAALTTAGFVTNANYLARISRT